MNGETSVYTPFYFSIFFNVVNYGPQNFLFFFKNYSSRFYLFYVCTELVFFFKNNLLNPIPYYIQFKELPILIQVINYSFGLYFQSSIRKITA